MKKTSLLSLFLFIGASFFLSGCSTIEKAEQADILATRVESLQHRLEQERQDKLNSLRMLREEKVSETERLLKQKDTELERIVSEKNEQIARMIEERNRDRKLYQILSQKATEARRDLKRKEAELKRVLAKNDEDVRRIIQEKEEQISSLEQAKIDLSESLKDELKEYKAKLEMTERGLVITFLAEIFFNSGKAEIVNDATESLRKVAEVLLTQASDSNIAIEGHTDNVPIRHSNWESNWELSVARALAVVHFFIEEAGVSPERLSAVGYGEYRPVKSNDTADGRQQNRRVEVVILPEKVKKR